MNRTEAEDISRGLDCLRLEDELYAVHLEEMGGSAHTLVAAERYTFKSHEYW